MNWDTTRRRRAAERTLRGWTWELSWSGWATLGLGLLGSACVASPSTPSVSDRVDWIKSDANMNALNVRVHGFYELFQSSVSNASDRASAASTSADERRELLLWKVEATTLALAATFRSDTLVAMLDLWTLCIQLRDELDSGQGEERLGVGAQSLRLTMDELIEEIEKIAATVLVDDDLEPAASMIDSARQRHPIDGALHTRVSGVSHHADLAMGDYELSDVLGSMAARVHDISLLMNVMTSELPRMIRWQTELLIGEELASLAASVERLAHVAEQMPAIVERERHELTNVIREERAAILAAVDQQRIVTLEVLREERVALTEFIRAERVAVLEGVDQQRLETIAALGEERMALVDDFGDERRETIEEVAESLVGTPAIVRQIVDHFFLRVVQLGAVLIALLVLAYVGRRTLVRG